MGSLNFRRFHARALHRVASRIPEDHHRNPFVIRLNPIYIFMTRAWGFHNCAPSNIRVVLVKFRLKSRWGNLIAVKGNWIAIKPM